MFISTEGDFYIDDTFGEIPISYNENEIIIRFLNTNGASSSKRKLKKIRSFLSSFQNLERTDCLCIVLILVLLILQERLP